MTRARKTPGRISFIGAGPGDPGLLAVAAVDALRRAEVVVADERAVPTMSGLTTAEVRPAEATPAETAKVLLAEARAGRTVVRLVCGDAFADDFAVKELLAVAKTVVPFEVVPGIPVGTGTAAYAGVPVGGVRTEADARDLASLDIEALAHAPGTLLLTVAAADLPHLAEQLVANGLKPDTTITVSCDGTGTGQQTVSGTLGDAELAAVGMAGTLIVAVGKAAGFRDRLAWWESRPLYGWRVLVPRTKEQAGVMSERLRSYGSVPIEVPTIAVEPPRTPTQMERAIKGLVTGRYEWIVFTSTNAVRAVREKFEEFGLDARAFAGVKIACVGESTAEAVRAFGISPELVSVGRAVLRGPAGRLPAVRRRARPDRPRAAAAGRHRHRDARRRAARARLGDRRRHGLPHRSGGAAGGRDPRRDQVRRIPGGLLHLVLDSAQPRRHRRQAARAHGRGLHRPADGRDGARVRAAGRRAARERDGVGPRRRAGRVRRGPHGRGTREGRGRRGQEGGSVLVAAAPPARSSEGPVPGPGLAQRPGWWVHARAGSPLPSDG